MDSSDEEVEFDIVSKHYEVQPYMFEPLAHDRDEKTSLFRPMTQPTKILTELATLTGETMFSTLKLSLICQGRPISMLWHFNGRCSCGHCVPMTTGRESLCCVEVPDTDTKIIEGDTCITQGEQFKIVCTNKGVVRTVIVIYVHDHGPIPDSPKNE